MINTRNLIIKGFFPLACGIAAFASIRPVIVEAIFEPLSSNYIVKLEANEDGITQIKYENLDNGKKLHVSNNKYVNADPVSENNSIAWSAQVDSLWQIFYYDIDSDSIIQLTTLGNNVHPKISEGTVVWEGQVDGLWQAFMFDGIKVSQISDGEAIVQEVGIWKNYIVFIQSSPNEDNWVIFLYDISKGSSIELGRGRGVRIENGLVSWVLGVGSEVFEFTYDVITTQFASDAEILESTESSFPEEPILNLDDELEGEIFPPVTNEEVALEIGAEVPESTSSSE